MKKVLITGGAGFIGTHLALRLLEKNYDVTVIDNLSLQIHGANPEITSPLYASIKNKVHFINDTILSKTALLQAIGDNQVIVHLAAETGTGQSMYQIFDYVNTNSNGTALLLDILANEKTSVKKVVVASSRAIYGEGKYKTPHGLVMYPANRQKENLDQGIFDLLDEQTKTPLQVLATDENSLIHPSSVYGITKYVQEKLISTVCPTIGIAPVVFRYQNVYGPGQSLQNPYTGILSIFSTLIRNKKTINIFEDGKESRDFVYIDDVVSATIAGIENDAANGQIFNVGTGIPTTVLSVAQQLCQNFNTDTPIHISGNYRLGDIRHNFADLSKLKDILHFTPQFSFSQGLKNFTNWVKEQEVQKSTYEQSIQEMKQKGLLK